MNGIQGRTRGRARKGFLALGALAALLFAFLAVHGAATASAPAGHFEVDAATGVVHDTKTGLLWQRFAVPPRRNFTDAQTYCQALQLGGIDSGWRLPTVREVASILDPQNPTPPIWVWDVFGDSGPGQIWTTTPDVAGSMGEIWILDVAVGEISSVLPATSQGVLCVH